MKTIVLTGATGFIGKQIHKALVERGHKVCVVIRHGSVHRLAATADVITEVDDLFSMAIEDWVSILQDADMVIHSAWYVTPGTYLDSKVNLTCVEGSLRLFEAAQMARIQHFVALGTCMEYKPTTEKLDIGAELGPTTLYAASKLALLNMMQQRNLSREMRLTWCRLFYLYGEGEYPQRLVPYIRNQIRQGLVAKLGSGIQKRDFLDVADAGKMIANIAESEQEGIINICSGVSTTIRELAEKIAAEYDRNDLLSFGTAALHPSDPVSVVGVCNAVQNTKDTFVQDVTV